MLLAVATAFAIPGWSSSLDTLDHPLRSKLTAVLAALREEGFTPTLSNTWRSPAIQDVLARVGSATEASGGQSCHNHLDSDGQPASRAADIWNRPLDLRLMLGVESRLLQELAFLRALGRHAHAEGLRWGGDWHGHASAWTPHGLGWDPAHVELGRCAAG